MSIPITPGSGAYSVAAQQVAGLQYQQIQVLGPGGSSVLGVNPDNSINVSVIGAISTQIAGNASIITVGQGSIATVIIGGSVAASFTPPVNQSVSGTVGASVIGLVPVQTSNTSVISYIQNSVATVIIGGSIAAVSTPAANQSVSGTVNIGSVITLPGFLSTGNSTTSNLGANGSFVGSFEEIKDFGSFTVTVQSDQNSAADGLLIQQSRDGTNAGVINTDNYTVASVSGRTFGFQPAARFARVIYTNGGTNQNTFAIQTIYRPTAGRPSSQRPNDQYTNETDLIQDQAFGMVYNGSSWDRQRGNATNGTLVYGSILTTAGGVSSVALVGANTVSVVAATPLPIAGSVAAFQAGTQITSLVSTVPSSVLVGTSIFGQLPAGTAVLGSVAALQGTNPWVVNFANSSIIAIQAGSVVSINVGSVITVNQANSIAGTYAEDSAHTPGDRGLFALGVRNDILVSVTSATGDYSQLTTGPVGEQVIANSPITAWVQGTADFRPTTGATSLLVIAAGGNSVFTYVTGIQVANMGSASVLVTFNGGTDSIMGYTIAPAGGGSNIVYPNALRTPTFNKPFTASISGTASVLISAQGFKANI